VNILSAVEHSGTQKNTVCSVGPLQLWRNTSNVILLHTHLFIYRLSNPVQLPLVVAKMVSDEVDIGLEYILHSQRPPDPHAA